MNKKNTIIRIVLLASFIMFFTLNSCKSDGEGGGGNLDSTEVSGNEGNLPNIDKQNYETPSELSYLEVSKDILYDKFYPIGWSKDGLFAYVSEPADEATGYYFFKINIVNTNTNTVVWTWEINEANEIENSSVKETWASNYDKFQEALNDYKIIMQKDISLITFPLKSNKNSYEINTKLSHDKDPMGFGFDVVSEVNIKLQSEKGTKEVLKRNILEDAFLTYKVLGYVKSPYQEQIAIFIRKEQRGYEGPPNVFIFETVGCNLTSGF